MYKIDGKIKQHYLAWWNCDVLDKVALVVRSPAEKQKPFSVIPATIESRFDIEKSIELAETNIQNTFFGGMAIPQYWPNLGPDIFSGFLGAKLNFTPFGQYPCSWADWHNPVMKELN